MVNIWYVTVLIILAKATELAYITAVVSNVTPQDILQDITTSLGTYCTQVSAANSAVIELKPTVVQIAGKSDIPAIFLAA